MSITRATTAVFLAGLVAGGMSTQANAGATAVVELFTSQGCSSCPPADKLFNTLADRTDILTLSFNVDYWDYLGWKDTLASPDNSQRQRNYAAARGDGQVYTPQAVIDGMTHVTGSNESAIDAAIDSAGPLKVPIALASTGDSVTVNIGAAPGMPHATLWLVMYDRAITVPVRRGENTGKTITYANVVKKLRPIAMWKGEPMSVDLPKSEMTQAKAGRCAVLLQTEAAGGLPGPILGAATINGPW